MVRVRYNLDLLKEIIKRDECKVDLENLPKILNKTSRIPFMCKCNINNVKTFKLIHDCGAFCKICTEKKRKEKIIQTNLIKRGVQNPSQYKQVKEKKEQTNLKNRGVKNPAQDKEVRDKMEQTNLKKRGVKNAMQSKEVREKAEQTNLRKRGVKNAMQSKEVLEKVEQTNLKKRGVKYSIQCPKVRDKIEQTNLKNHGVKNLMHVPEIAEKASKNAFKFKEYTLPSGKIINIQGYEYIALDYLFENSYSEDDIITSKIDVPEIWYTDNEDKEHRYYCDIYIKSENKIIEVKSTWTYELKEEINLLKAEASVNAGYKFEFWIYDKNKNLEIYELEIYELEKV